MVTVYCRVIACDFDGTGASDGHLATEVATALQRARAAGVTCLLVTGRVLEDLRVALVDFANFDAVVAENGAVLWFPERGHTIQLGRTPPEQFLGSLRAAGIPFKAGAVVIGTWEGHATQSRALIRQAGLDLHLVFNRGALMLLPSGVDKANGVRRALQELGRSERNMIAFGDAENDLPLFAAAELAVAARGSVQGVAALADEQLTRPGASGVAHYVDMVLDARCHVRSSARRQIVLGRGANGATVSLPVGDSNVLVSGDPRTGKSWLAGMVAERLLELGYRLCILDPEGDHHSVADRPGCVLLGRRLALPAPNDLAQVLADLETSVVVSLSSLSLQAKAAYVRTAFEELARERARTGLPHWLLVDEAHYFFRAEDAACAELLGETGNVILATYRPSLLAPAALDTIDAYLVRRTEVDVERYFVEGLLGARGPKDCRGAEMLDGLRSTQAGLLLTSADGASWQTFVPGARLSEHIHHGRKYAEGGVPPEKAFRFSLPGGAIVAIACTVREFADAIQTVPLESLRAHLRAHDFSRWSRDVLGDAELAAGLAKLEYTSTLGGQPSRSEIIDHIGDRYVL